MSPKMSSTLSSIESWGLAVAAESASASAAAASPSAGLSPLPAAAAPTAAAPPAAPSTGPLPLQLPPLPAAAVAVGPLGWGARHTGPRHHAAGSLSSGGSLGTLPPGWTTARRPRPSPPPPPTTTPAAEDEAAQEGSRVKRSREVRGDKLMLLTWRSALSCLGPGNQLSPRSHWYTSLACTTGVVARVASKRRLTSPGDVQTYPGSLTLHWTVSLIVASGVSSSSSGSNSSL
mmetsp:Transcript_161183/g.517433  ORF Transcript_161183/g.517433 Transcript_161183/m.517433 type:complete len:232 (+) Transcript_161183:71-766(+)